MERLDGNSATSVWKTLPAAIWTYFAALIIFAVVAIEFSTLTFHPTALSIAIYVILLTGLLRGSRICRWILITLSLIAAFSILVVLTGAGDFADAMLVVIPLGQAGLLFSPSARNFTDSRKQPT